MAAKGEVDPVNGFQITSCSADADAVESPHFHGCFRTHWSPHRTKPHSANRSEKLEDQLLQSYSPNVLHGNRPLGYGELLFHVFQLLFLSDTKQSHSKTSHFVFSAISKMAAKHDSITKQSYILRLFVPFLITKLRVDFNSMSMVYFIVIFEAMASHSQTNHLVLEPALRWLNL